MAQQKRPDKTIKLPDSGLEVTMTYLLLNDILRFLGTVDEAISAILTNQETRDIIVRRLFTDSKTTVEKVEDLIGPEELELDIFEIDDLLAWVMEHVAYFFMKTAKSVQERMGKFPEFNQKTTTLSNLSETGSEA